MSALIDEAHEFLCIMDKQEYADEVYRLRARVAELEAQIAAPAAAVADVPDAKPEMPWLSEFEEGHRQGWNACRDEMLAARQPSQDVVRDAESADDCCRGAAPARFCKCSNTDERLRIATSLTHAVIDLNRGWNEHLPKGEIAERLDLCRRFAIAILASNKEKGQ
jgi:hypothetical protein